MVELSLIKELGLSGMEKQMRKYIIHCEDWFMSPFNVEVGTLREAKKIATKTCGHLDCYYTIEQPSNGIFLSRSPVLTGPGTFCHTRWIKQKNTKYAIN